DLRRRARILGLPSRYSRGPAPTGTARRDRVSGRERDALPGPGGGDHARDEELSRTAAVREAGEPQESKRTTASGQRTDGSLRSIVPRSTAPQPRKNDA